MLGKYFAAVAIVTVALLFSMATNCIVLGTLGEPGLGPTGRDLCRLLADRLAMLAIGQVASFLTKNLTVAYVLGALFNAPLVFAPLAGSFFARRYRVGDRVLGNRPLASRISGTA